MPNKVAGLIFNIISYEKCWSSAGSSIRKRRKEKKNE
jgi:hypothetical protein